MSWRWVLHLSAHTKRLGSTSLSCRWRSETPKTADAYLFRPRGRPGDAVDGRAGRSATVRRYTPRSWQPNEPAGHPGSSPGGAPKRRDDSSCFCVSGLGCKPYSLHVGQLVHLLAGSRVEVPVDFVELVVDLAVLRPGLDGGGDRAPVGVRVGQPDGSGSEERIPVARPYGLLREVLRPARHVRDDPGPEAAFRPAAHGHEPLPSSPGVAHELEDVPDAVSGRLEHRPVQMTAAVA